MFGADSLFGGARHTRTSDEEGARVVEGFSPVPGFVFDFEVRRAEGDESAFVVRFEQPQRRTPYLAGGFVWWIEPVGEDGGEDRCRLREEINTPAALALAPALGGPRPSLRRWLFFRVGHGQVMQSLTQGLARLT